MCKRYDKDKKQEIMALYQKGTSVRDIAERYEISRSTLYFWIRECRTLKTVTDQSITYHDYLDLKRHADKLERQLEIAKAVECSASALLPEKLAALEKLHGQYSVRALCDTLDVDRGTFYNHLFRRKKVTVYDQRREEILKQVQIVFNEGKQRYGAKKICAVLAERGITTSPRYVSGLMREMDLQCVGRNSKREYSKRVKRARLTNIVQRQFDVAKPNSVWVSDTTYFKVKDRFLYTCVIIDLFSRKVVAHGVSFKHSSQLITSTFKKAIAARNPTPGLIFHSDRGAQYTSKTFARLLQQHNVSQSFSASGSPHDNAVAEAFFSSMKKEELYRTNYRSEREFRTGVDAYIQFYNAERPHSTLAFKTPDKFERVITYER